MPLVAPVTPKAARAGLSTRPDGRKPASYACWIATVAAAPGR